MSDHEAATVARAAVASTLAGYPFVLSVIDGPDVGKSLQVDESRSGATLIGKSHACDLQLTDRSVSRRHVSVEVKGQTLRLRDLGSTNGTQVNDLSVLDALLTGGETVRIGATTVRVDRGEQVALPELDTADQFGITVGASERMRRLYPICERLAQANVPLVIEGETGVGKEQLAESIHQAGPRAEGPFVVFDCTAVAPTLIESELFGHEKGSFTGAVGSHAGVFERAHGGTLLIDEIGDMPLSLQPKLLRVIERLQVTRVGGGKPFPVDVRLISATRRDLDQLVQSGAFRDDLYHRLAVARVELPPLRARAGDVERLARHFWSQQGHNPAEIPREVLLRWRRDAWPGNVRELRNAVLRRLALGDLGDALEQLSPGRPSASHVVGPAGDAIAAVLALGLPLTDARQRVVDELERRYVEQVLAENDGNMKRAATAAGMGRRHFQRIAARFLSAGEEDDT